jgi:hypothetical protein
MRLEGFSIKRGHGVPTGFNLSLRMFLSSKFFRSIGCSFNFILKVGGEESIVNAPQITDHVSAV